LSGLISFIRYEDDGAL